MPHSTRPSLLENPQGEEAEARLFLERVPNPVAGFEIATFYQVSEGRRCGKVTESRIGGDFYEVAVQEGGTVALAVGDICGHGPVAAAQAIKIKAKLKGLWCQTASPTHVMSLLNNYIYKDRDMAALSLVRANGNTGDLHFAVAGMEPPLLLRPGVGVESVSSEGIALGLLPNRSYQGCQSHMAPGDLLVLMTDGLVEARPCRGPILGMGRIIELLDRRRDLWKCTHCLGSYLLNATLDYAGCRLADDRCLLIARRLPPSGEEPE